MSRRRFKSNIKPRRKDKRVERKRLVIVSEGEKTEPIYFKKFRRREINLQIITPNCAHTDPKGLIEFAYDIKFEDDINEKNGDRIICVFDVNSNTEQQLKEAKTLGKRRNIDLCLSNPCFEIWILIHFEIGVHFSNCDSLIHQLKKHIPRYEKSAEVYSQILPHIDDAIIEAKRLNKWHLNNGTELFSRNSNPSTQVFEIIEYIMTI